MLNDPAPDRQEDTYSLKRLFLILQRSRSNKVKQIEKKKSLCKPSLAQEELLEFL